MTTFAPENTRLIILAAKKNARMERFLNMPVCLAPVGDSPLLHRTMRQLHEVGFIDQCVVLGYQAAELETAARACFPAVGVVHCPCFTEDMDFLSLLQAVRELEPGQGALIVRGDALVTDNTALRVACFAAENESALFLCGGPTVLGVYIASSRISAFRLLLEHFCKIGGDALDAVKEIFFCGKRGNGFSLSHAPLSQLSIEYCPHIRRFPYISRNAPQAHVAKEFTHFFSGSILDVGLEGGTLCVTPQDYAHALHLAGAGQCSETDITLLEVTVLRHTEEFDPKRVEWLARKIDTEGVWTVPLAVSREHSLVMDGQHRLEAALRLGLRRVPATVLDYAMIPVYSLRPGFVVTVDELVSRALACNPYPYKTAKHVLPLRQGCRIALAELR